MKLKELSRVIEKADRGKIDIPVKSSDLYVNAIGELVVGDRAPIRPNSWGWYLLLNRISKGATKRYLFRHPSDQWIELVNYDLRHSNLDLILRTRHDDLLGVVSGNYRKFDNREVLKALVENLGDMPVHRYHLDDRFLYMRILYPSGDFSIKGEEKYHLGFSVCNSEVGFRSLGSSAFLYKLACQNDAQFAEHTRMRFRHVGHTFEDMREGLGNAIFSGKRLKDYYVDLVRQASEEVIEEDAFKAIMAQVKKMLRLSTKRADEIVTLFAEEPNTRLGLINSITHYCHRLRGDQRFMLEAGAGSLLKKTISGGELITVAA